jgi:hypothetical protein
MERKTAAERWSAAVQTRGCRSWTSGRGVAVGNGETHGAVGWDGRG